MSALSLFLVLAAAKVISLAPREVAVSWWAGPAYLWQDALVAGLYAGLELVTRRQRWVSWACYAAIVFYTALNVPVLRVLGSPFTWQMSRAAGSALADSIAYYCTFQNLAGFLLVLGAGATFPFILKRASRRTQRTMGLVGLVIFVLGPFAARQLDTGGLERNALVTFVRSTFPRVTPKAIDEDWRRSPIEAVAGLKRSLLDLRGAAAGRNVVLILLESTGAGYLRPFGGVEDPMPTLSHLAEQAILFENAYAVYPESIKGLFSVICSRYPAFDTVPEDYERVDTPGLAQVLAEAGYRTGLFHSGRFAYLGMESVVFNRGYEVLEDAGAIGGNFQSSFGVDEPATVKRILAWIDSLAGKEKFFLTYLPIAGHHPYDAPEPRRYSGSDEQTHYLNALHYGDQALRELLEGFQSRGLESNTLFVILGDHGEAFGQHEGNSGHTLFIYEENMHVPCLLVAPGLFRNARRVTQVVSLIDASPTVLELLNLPVPSDWQGASLLQIEERMALFYTDYSLGFLGLRDGPWKFIYEMESGRSKLFHLPADAKETRNLAAGYPDRVRAYREHLKEWSAGQKGFFKLQSLATYSEP